MWSAFVRQIAAYALTRRGKRLAAFIGVLLLCFATVLLIDMQLYLSAGFTAVLTCFAVAAYIVQHARLKHAEREHLLRKAEKARQRAISAQVRAEKFDSAKSAVGQAVNTAVDKTVHAVGDAIVDAAHEAASVVSGTAQAVNRSAEAVSSGVGNTARAGVFQLVKGWRTLRGK